MPGMEIHFKMSYILNYRITLRWEDRRLTGSVNSFVQGDSIVQTYNEHRKSECPSNHVPYDDTAQVWKPYIQVLNALEVVMLNTLYFMILLLK